MRPEKPEALLPRRLGPARKIGLALEIIGAYLQARRELARAPITLVMEQLRKGDRDAGEPASYPLAEIRRLARAVSRTLALTPGDTRCLIRSLVLTRLLAKRGVQASLVIAARSGPDFLAHAWVEYQGVPVLTPGDSSFGRLVEL